MGHFYAWDWYIVPAGAFTATYGEREQWDNGVGAVRVAMLPSAKLGDKEVEGELWFVGGREAYNQAEQVEFDKGSEWA